MAENKTIKGSIQSLNTYHTDAYMIAVKNGFEGTEQEWLDSLRAKNTEEAIAAANRAMQGEQNVKAAEESAKADIEAATNSAVSHIEAMADEALDIVQVPGDSETKVMSQKATTNAINELRDAVVNSDFNVIPLDITWANGGFSRTNNNIYDADNRLVSVELAAGNYSVKAQDGYEFVCYARTLEGQAAGYIVNNEHISDFTGYITDNGWDLPFKCIIQVRRTDDGVISVEEGSHITVSKRENLNAMVRNCEAPEPSPYEVVRGIYVASAPKQLERGNSDAARIYVVDVSQSAYKKYIINAKGHNRFRLATTIRSIGDIPLNTQGYFVRHVALDEELPQEYTIDTTGANYLLVYLGSVDTIEVTVKPYTIVHEVNKLANKINGEASHTDKTKIIPVVGSPRAYFSESIEARNIDGMLHDEVYGIYDALLNDYPEWIKREEDIGSDSAGNAIRHYTVRMQKPVTNSEDLPTVDVNLWSAEYDYPHLLINAGTHGDEKSSVYGVALFIDELVKSNEEWAMFIKSNFVLDIIPILNVWGFDNMSRNNRNGVNINRDFGVGDTVESRVLLSFINSLGDKLTHILDSHNVQTELGFFGVTAGSERFNQQMHIGTKLSALIAPRMAELYNNRALFPYFYSWQSTNGPTTLTAWAVFNGYGGGTFEAPRSIGGGTVNNAQTSEITKMLLGNLIQMSI